MTISREKMERVWAVINAGVEEQRNKFIAENPGITDDELKKAMNDWFLEPRPPDAPGRPITRARFKRIFGRDATTEEQLRLRLR